MTDKKGSSIENVLITEKDRIVMQQVIGKKLRTFWLCRQWGNLIIPVCWFFLLSRKNGRKTKCKKFSFHFFTFDDESHSTEKHDGWYFVTVIWNRTLDKFWMRLIKRNFPFVITQKGKQSTTTRVKSYHECYEVTMEAT